VYRSRDRYTASARFRTWLFRVATNHCLNEKRRAWRQREVSTKTGIAGLRRPAPIEFDPAAVTQGLELAAAVQQAIAALPERQRVAVVLARYEGCTMKEIGDVLGIRDGAVKALLNRARTALTHKLSPFLKPDAT
jgi:RNA polymerase sigma-70 factor (ECF subfamily)